MLVNRLIGITICLLITVSLMITGCASQPAAPPGSVASIDEAVICHSFDQTKGPSSIDDTFMSSDPWIICTLKVKTAPSGTTLKARWFYPDGTIKEQATDAAGTGYYSFVVRPKERHDFPVGDYTVKVFVNNEEKASLGFKVQQ